MAEVTLRGISKVYPGGVQALNPVDLKVLDGELLVLVGPSGCGKTTLLRIIAGLEEPSGGSVFIGETDVTGAHPKDRDVAMVFQNYALYPHMTVFENLAFGLRMRKTPKESIKSKVKLAAETLGISNLLERKPAALSGGQRQRVALGRAMVRDPKVFLLDEPLSNLDAVLRIQMRTELVRTHRALGATMVYVTHDQTEAMTMGDHIAVMSEGRVLQLGSPSEVYSRPACAFVARFIGSPPMNLWEAKVLDDGRMEVPGAAAPLAPPAAAVNAIRSYSGGRVLVGARPEGLRALKARPAGPHLEGTVEIVESTGVDVLLYISSKGGELTVRSMGQAPPEAGEKVYVEILAESIHLFEPEAQTRIE